MDWVMLYSSPRSLRHMRREVVNTFLGMAASAAVTFSCLLDWEAKQVGKFSRSHLRIVFWVDHAQYPYPRFFREMGYLRLVSASLFGRNTRLIWWKRCLRIWCLSLDPPWMTEIKLSR